MSELQRDIDARRRTMGADDAARLFFRLARRRGWFQKRASRRPTLRVASRRETRRVWFRDVARTRVTRRGLQTARHASGVKIPEPVEENGVARLDTNGT